MESPKNRDEIRSETLRAWYDYGERFDVFAKQEQPAPTVWEPELPEPDKNGTSTPQIIKHWRMLDLTKRFIRERYRDYGIFTTPSLKFNCLAPHFQSPLPIDPDERESRGWSPTGDPPDWYAGCLRIGIFQWQVGFSCSSGGCRRDWCRLNLKNPKRVNPVDVYSMLMIFEGVTTPKAKSEVQKWFGGKLGKFGYTGKEKNRRIRYAVSKSRLMDLIKGYAGTRHQHVQVIVEAAADLIRLAPQVDWHGRLFSDESSYLSKEVVTNVYRIGSPAIRLYLWLLMHQEEEARRNRFQVKLTDTEVADLLNVNKSTIGRYRRQLVERGLLEVNGNVWTVKIQQ